MKVLLFCEKDWANISYSLSAALNRVGVQADAYKLSNHGQKDNNKNQATLITMQQIIPLWKRYDVIQFMHSGQNTLVPQRNYKRVEHEDRSKAILHKLNKMKKNGNSKILVGFHGSSYYRSYYQYINMVMNPIVDGSIIQTGDLLGLGAKNEEWILAPIDVDNIDVRYKRVGRKLVVAHYPSMRDKKNSDMIDEVVGGICREHSGKIEYRTGKSIPHKQNMNRISECDIYIDHQAYELGGQPYGEFGIAALEAAAMGKIVVSCTGKQKRYEKENGKIGMLVSNSPEELKSTLVSLVTKEDRQLHKIRKQCRFWVERYHSYRYIGKKTESFYARLLEEKRK